MGVYVDQLINVKPYRKSSNERWNWPQSCHLMADSEEELHAFANMQIMLIFVYCQNTETRQFENIQQPLSLHQGLPHEFFCRNANLELEKAELSYRFPTSSTHFCDVEHSGRGVKNEGIPRTFAISLKEEPGSKPVLPWATALECIEYGLLGDRGNVRSHALLLLERLKGLSGKVRGIAQPYVKGSDNGF